MFQRAYADRSLLIARGLLVISVALLSACTPATTHVVAASSNVEVSDRIERLDGLWIANTTGGAMEDPQTSGLVAWRGKLLSISDRSAVPKQRMRIHVIDPANGRLQEESFPIFLSEQLKSSCFAEYIGDNPDLEALMVDPKNDKVFYTVTEDASTFSLSKACKKRFSNTGSTDYPTVLVRLELQDDGQVLMTHARPIRFAPSLAVGDSPNDGIEGLTIDDNNRLYLGLEKDNAGNARIFELTMGDDFWATDDFADAKDSQFTLPEFEKGNHPINALQYVSLPNGDGVIVAAARNDDQLWVIHLDKETPTSIINLAFWAPTSLDGAKEDLDAIAGCKAWEEMDNASIEGVAVLNGQLWLVNDPWKRQYLKNIQCESNANRYKSMSPLLFKLPVQSL